MVKEKQLAVLVLAISSVCSSLARYPHGNAVFANDRPDVSHPMVEGYQTRHLEGWLVYVSEDLSKQQPELTKQALSLIELQLRQIVQVLPSKPLAAIQSVPIWLSPQYNGFRPTAEYHPDADWLKKHGRREQLAGCVELTNITIFERECQRMPMMILHELAHAYHHQVLGFDDRRIIAAYESAKSSQIYKSVKRKNGVKQRAYAISNHKEYFAESTEAFFGQNDFYPFNRDQLRKHDPRMYKLLCHIWQAKPVTDAPSLRSQWHNRR